MKLHRLFTFLLLSLCFTATFAQSNFRRGFIITNEGDTVNGWIDFRTDVRNMQACNFRKTETGETRTFLPGEIFGYRFYEEGKFYVSREIVIDGEPRTVFLEFVVQGMMNLYYYIDTLPDDNVEYFFFEDQSGRMIPARRRPDTFVLRSRSDRSALNNSGGIERRQDFHYKGIVRYLFGEHETIERQINNLDFSHRTMINIVREYHDLTCPIGEECIIFETRETRNYFTKPKFSIYGGILSLLLRSGFMDNSIEATAPMIGGRLNIFAPRIDNNLSFQVDLGLARIADLQQSTYYLVPTQVGLKFAFFEHKIRPTVGGGTSFLYVREIYKTPTTNLIYHSLLMYFYLSLGVEFHISDKHAIFVDVEYARSAFAMITPRRFAYEPTFLQLKAGYRF